jgi:hypothetical protein
LAKPLVSTNVSNDALQVISSVYCHAVHLKDEGRGILADNYFDLLPGVPRRIAVSRPSSSGGYPLAAIMPIRS